MTTADSIKKTKVGKENCYELDLSSDIVWIENTNGAMTPRNRTYNPIYSFTLKKVK